MAGIPTIKYSYMVHRSIVQPYQMCFSIELINWSPTMIIRSIAALALISLSTLSNQASAATTAAPTRLANAECDVPAYRNSWQDDELQGNVKLAVLVDAQGNVKDTKVISSSGHVALDRASLHASTACKFKPATSGADPVWAQVQYNWVLN